MWRGPRRLRRYHSEANVACSSVGGRVVADGEKIHSVGARDRATERDDVACAAEPAREVAGNLRRGGRVTGSRVEPVLVGEVVRAAGVCDGRRQDEGGAVVEERVSAEAVLDEVR